MPDAPECYCGAPTNLRKSEYGYFYGCSEWPQCDGLVGCHPGTKKPLGAPANKETRQARKVAHETFDAIWQSDDGPSRGGAYEWLAWKLDVEPDDCHIGEFDLDTCKKVVAYASTVSPRDVADRLDEINEKFEQVTREHIKRLQRDTP